MDLGVDPEGRPRPLQPYLHRCAAAWPGPVIRPDQ